MSRNAIEDLIALAQSAGIDVEDVKDDFDALKTRINLEIKARENGRNQV